jgi:hypothetical protein
MDGSISGATVLQPATTMARRRLLRWTALLVVILAVLLGRVIATVAAAGDGRLAAACFGAAAWLWLLRAVARLDAALGQPFSAAAKVCALGAIAPLVWIDLAEPLPGVGTLCLGATVVAIEWHRRRRDAEAGVFLGAVACVQPGALWWVVWLGSRSRRWPTLAALVVTVAALAFVATWRLDRSLESIGVSGVLARDLDDPSFFGRIWSLGDASVRAGWLGAGVVVAACAALLARIRVPGGRVALTEGEIAAATLVAVAVGPSAGLGAGAVWLLPASVAFNAWAMSSARRRRRVGLALWALGVAGVWTAALGNQAGVDLAAMGLWVAALAWLALVTWPRFYPMAMARPVGGPRSGRADSAATGCADCAAGSAD